MHALIAILAMLHIHGVLAATIVKDAPVAYRDVKAAYQVIAAYEKEKARLQSLRNVSRPAQHQSSAGKVRQVSASPTRVAVH